MIIGIDLGTTNSAVGIWRDGQATLIPNSLGHVLTPSAVSVDEDSDSILVGLAARERQSTHPDLTAVAFKRYMGTDRTTRLGKRAFAPEDLSALVLGRLKADAEAFLGEPVTEAVITVPAYFNDRQRKATRKAAELAGLKVERLLNEPTAAALAFGIHNLGDETRFLVFDLGGGTFDVSVLEIFEGVIEVRSSTGDNRLGGEDFNAVLVEEFRRVALKDLPKKDLEDIGLRERVNVAAERARRGLTTADEVTMTVTWKDRQIEQTFSADGFEELCKPLLTRLRDPVLRGLRDAGIQTEQLNEIILVGGSTRMPVVRRAITRMFGRFPANAVNPDEAVAIGAAVQAGLKARDVDLKEVVLTDVCPYSLGVEVAERDPRHRLITGLFSPIIERNTVIPASRVEVYFPMEQGQRQLPLKIYQGESRHVIDNVPLGELSVPMPAGRIEDGAVEVRFTYDINGLLEVDAHVLSTGETRQLVVADAQTRASPDFEKRREALAALKQHPRDSDANKAAMARANRCYEDAIGDSRAYLNQVITRFELVLSGQDPREIDRARAEMLEILDQFEGQTWL